MRAEIVISGVTPSRPRGGWQPARRDVRRGGRFVEAAAPLEPLEAVADPASEALLDVLVRVCPRGRVEA